MKTYTADVKEDPETGDQILQFPPEFVQEQDWREGDRIDWDVKDGQIIAKNLSKEEREMPVFIVEAVSMFRMRYAVRCKSAEHAMDTVTMHEAEDMSQLHLGETITSAREVSESEYLKIFDEDNDYLKSWSDEKKQDFIHVVDYNS